MSRKLMAVLVSSALVFGNVSTSAWSATTVSGTTQQTEAAQSQPAQVAAAPSNPSPLPPGGAAGIKEAQAFELTPLVGVLLVVGVVAIIYFLLKDEDDDDEAPVTT